MLIIGSFGKSFNSKKNECIAIPGVRLSHNKYISDNKNWCHFPCRDLFGRKLIKTAWKN